MIIFGSRSPLVPASLSVDPADVMDITSHFSGGVLALGGASRKMGG